MDPTGNGRLVVLVVGLDSWDPLMNGIVTARVPQESQTTIYHELNEDDTADILSH